MPKFFLLRIIEVFFIVFIFFVVVVVGNFNRDFNAYHEKLNYIPYHLGIMNDVEVLLDDCHNNMYKSEIY